MSCNGCGKCCQVISLGETSWMDIEQWVLDNYPDGYNLHDVCNSDLLFIYLSWEPITREKAMAINPEILEYGEHFFICKLFEDNQCPVHNMGMFARKPHVCKDYPCYDEPLKKEMLFTGCGFHDVVK